MTRLRTAPAARDDIREIRSYSKERFGARAAREYLTGLAAIFDLIEARPLIGVAERALGNGMHSFAYRSHRIYNKVECRDVLVVRILHQSRNVSGAFGSAQ